MSAILQQPEPAPRTNSKWKLRPCSTVASAMATLHQVRIPLVVTERDLSSRSWRDLLNNVLLLPDPPILIVSSRLADEYLWAEALNLGAYDVLAKPFDAFEVVRVLGSAWRHWTDSHDHVRFRNTHMRVAAGAA
ncbi:MAG TPA: hypothetical protein VMH85_05705 [Terriglobales bacterium]|nr:hypothetical protein [Terriglobales bacterium]